MQRSYRMPAEALLPALLKTDRHKVWQALEVAKAAHKDQKRASGEAYIYHSLAVMWLLYESGGDPALLSAGLLHDAVEDGGISLNEVKACVGLEVARLVDGVTKIASISTEGAQACLLLKKANYEKLERSLQTDRRIGVLKVADRMHNMMTLMALPVHKQIRISKETLSFAVPLAKSLNLIDYSNEMERLAHIYLTT